MDGNGFKNMDTWQNLTVDIKMGSMVQCPTPILVLFITPDYKNTKTIPQKRKEKKK